MKYHPLSVAGVIGAVLAAPFMALRALGGGHGLGAIIIVGGAVLLPVGMFVLIVLWVVETLRARD